MNIKSKQKLEDLLNDLTGMVVHNSFDEDEQEVVLSVIDELHELTVTPKESV